MAPSCRWLLFALVSVTFAMAQDTMVKAPEAAAPVDLVAEGSEVQEAVVVPHPMPEEGDMVEMGRSPRQHHSQTAAGVLKKIYAECISKGSFACAKPKVLAFLSSAAKRDSIPLTEDMAIVRKEGVEYHAAEAMSSRGYNTEEEREEALKALMLDRADTFLDTHVLRIRVPKEIVNGDLLPLVPKFLLQNIPAEVNIPLSDGRAVQGRGFVKKVIIPFLLGLKFKITALIPLALALIAMKTWKALTLGLLSLVLSGAMVIFRLSKPPKVVSYEVYHYPHAAPAIEVPAAHGWDPHHSYAKNSRSLDSMPLAYRGHYRH
ncbi:uncharacterized protein LOC124174100 [Ischnura elegans]|uniref:uncharacterized protein LOC124174100 n=1 Tax=Ischnura elegans TaxID=197161 RepID=UPI001ED88E29|nr:uncharacterized protein LOC124174100 [Ischnura elegans]